MDILSIAAVVLVGLLAGEELAVRWAVHPALVSLDDATQLRARQALIRALRVLVPIVFFAALAATIASTIVSFDGFTLAAALALIAWAGATFGGTVIINSAVVAWDPENPPEGWRDLIVRWARIDVVRSTAAIVALVLVALGAVGA